MQRTTKIAAIVVGLLVLGAGAAMAATNETDAPTAVDKEACRALYEAGEDPAALRECIEKSGKMNKRGWLHRHKAPAFEMTDEGVEGRFVSFGLDNGSLVDYAISGGFATTTLFDAITPADGLGEGRVKGGVYGAKGESSGLVAFNAPNAAWVYRAKAPTTLTLDVADDLVIEETDDGLRLVRGEHAAKLVLRGNASYSVDGDVVTIDIENGAVAFGIEGYPRVAHAEKMWLKKMHERRAAQQEPASIEE